MAGERDPDLVLPSVYSIAAHRGFADALGAGLVPRYGEEHFGLARLTLLLPSTRSARTMQEAFVRHYGEQGQSGLLLPRMVVVGDLDLDETLGPLIDTMGAGLDVPPAVDSTYRWLRLAELVRQARGDKAPKGSALLNLAWQTGQVMDRLLAEEVRPEALVEQQVLDLLPDMAGHWVESLKTFITVQHKWLAELDASGQVDAATRRNLLFRAAAQRLRDNPPPGPIVAAGVTSAAPALAHLLRTIADLPNGAVILPDLDLTLAPHVWEELGTAGDPAGEHGPFGREDAVTHPQYHLKVLLNRMGIARGEVRPWHRAGMAAAPPGRSHALASLFLPPLASRGWAALEADKRSLAGVRLMECAHPEEEAQAIALLVRQALAEPEKRVAVVTPDRGLAGRVVQHLRRWNVAVDDSAGRPLAQTAAGRVLLLLAEVMAQAAAPVPLVALLGHPLVRRGEGREDWLKAVRALDLQLRGPRPKPGLAALADKAAEAKVGEWWAEASAILEPLLAGDGDLPPADALDLLVTAGEALCGVGLWAEADGRALARFVETLRANARLTGLVLARDDLPAALRDAMDREAVRPPYGGHPRVAVYGLLEARMTRADLVICGGLNEGSWPAAPAADPVLAPAILRALGVPGADFRVGLAAHDLAGALGAPQVVLSRARRDAGGPAIASRFWLRVCALLGEDLVERHRENAMVQLAGAIDAGEPVPWHPRPSPQPSAEQRRRELTVTALDRLRSDPYQYYAQRILRLKELELLDAEPTAAWQGTLAHKILEDWHEGKDSLEELADHHLTEMDAHPLMRALWRPRLLKALEWVQQQVEADPARRPLAWEAEGVLAYRGVKLKGKADRIDRLADGTLAIVDYKTGKPSSWKAVDAGFAMQLGTLGLLARAGVFKDASDNDLTGEPTRFEYWSLGKSEESDTGFGYIETPLKLDGKRTGIDPAEFLPKAQQHLDDAFDRWILGEEGFTARLNPDAKVYAEFDHLMRLDEWMGREGGEL